MLKAKKLTALTFAAIIASALTISLTPAHAQKHGGGSLGHGGESASHSDGGGCSGCSGDEGGGKGGAKGRKGGSGFDLGHGGSGQSLRGIFHGMDSHSGTDQHYPGSDEHHDR